MCDLDMLTCLEIDIEAVTHCTERPNFDETRAPIHQMTDEDYRAGIRKVFADVDGWEEWMVEPLLTEYRKEKAIQQVAQDMAETIVGSLTFSRFF